mmetsp:Transcript_7894/g.22449  ORF Transcript_7894/g.22449 Transcript_7894/m.22449 type:complete len:85 (+) Transcript_7894:1039-1293(+)
MTVPTALFSGGFDYLADVVDVGRLRDILAQTGALVFESQQPTYAHLDFTWAPDAAQGVYSDLVKQLQQFLPIRVPGANGAEQIS